MIYRTKANKDTTIAYKKVGGTFLSASNVGASEVLEMFKTYSPGQTASILISFNSSSALTTFSSSYCSGSSSWHLVMRNVETDNPNIGSFDANIRPIEQIWDEGKGHDLDYWTDKSAANHVECRRNVFWDAAGAEPQTGSLSATFHFETGHEDLDIDVSSLLPSQYGFWIGLTPAIMADTQDYYKKAFRSRQTHFPQYQPYLELRWNDATGSWTSAFTASMDTTGTIELTFSDLRSYYDVSETPVLRIHIQPKDYNPAVFTTSSSDVSGTVLTNAYYRVVDNTSDDIVVPFGTGTVPWTKLSYDDNGNYFKFPMCNLVPGIVYRFDIGYYDQNLSWKMIFGDEKFRVGGV